MENAADIIRAILSGHADEHMDEIREALKQRREALAQINAATLQVGQRIRTKNLSPKYMNGIEGVITGRPTGNSKRFAVELDESPNPMRYSTKTRIPAACLEVIV